MLCWVSSVYAAAEGPVSADGGRSVVGRVGDETLLESDVTKVAQADFEKLDNEYRRSQQQLRLKFKKERYELLRKQTERLLDEDALAIEAKSRGATTDELIKQMPPSAALTEAEIHAFYDAHKDRISQTFEQISPQIRIYLAKQHAENSAREFYDSLRAKHGIVSLIAPYTMPVQAIGPARGPSDAPVTIVEFGDFQCPFCREAEATLHSVLESYPRQVRLIFRNLPLTQIHPNAGVAARAAVCAEKQRQFWPMHDAMYSDQKLLTLEDLKNTATRLGLNKAQFEGCLKDSATDGALSADAKAADDLGINDTPFFFINGQPLDGSVPLEQFRQIIEGELHRIENSSKRRVASN
jgi:protein-disulfide isomerase